MLRGQPREEELVSGHARLAVRTVSVMPASRSLDLQDLEKGFSTFAHSWSHAEGRPLEHCEELCVQQAELTRASQAW